MRRLLPLMLMLTTLAARAESVDFDTREIHLRVLYVGTTRDAALANLDFIARKMKVPRSTVGVVEHVDFPPNGLDKIRGFTIRLHLDVAPAGSWSPEVRAALFKSTDVLLFVADAGRAKENQKTLEQLRSGPKLPLVLQVPGDAAASAVVAKQLGVNDGVAANLETGEGVFVALKAATKLALMSLREKPAR